MNEDAVEEDILATITGLIRTSVRPNWLRDFLGHVWLIVTGGPPEIAKATSVMAQLLPPSRNSRFAEMTKVNRF